MMNTYNVYRPVALLSVSWNVAVQLLSVVIVSTTFNFSSSFAVINRLIQLVLVILIALMVARVATTPFVSAM